MALIIPWFDAPSFSEDVSLEGIVYKFQFIWNYRGQYWTMSIYDIDENPLVLGVQLVMRFNLTAHYPGRDLPPGVFMVSDPKGELDRIEEGDMGINAQLIYLTEEEAG